MGGTLGALTPPEDLHLVPSLGIERSKNTDLFNFNCKNLVQTSSVEPIVCSRGGGKKKSCALHARVETFLFILPPPWRNLVWHPCQATSVLYSGHWSMLWNIFFVNFINNLLVISFLITECRQCRHQYKNLLKWKTIWGWCHITQYSREADTMN